MTGRALDLATAPLDTLETQDRYKVGTSESDALFVSQCCQMMMESDEESDTVSVCSSEPSVYYTPRSTIGNFDWELEDLTLSQHGSEALGWPSCWDIPNSLEDTSSEAELARELNDLESRLSGTGDSSESTATRDRAILVVRELYKRNPRRWRDQLATMLHRQGDGYVQCHDLKMAMAFFREAAALRQQLRERFPEKLEPGPASSLYSYILSPQSVSRRAGNGVLKVASEELHVTPPDSSTQKVSNDTLVSDDICSHLCSHVSDETSELCGMIQNSYGPGSGVFSVRHDVFAHQATVADLTVLLQECLLTCEHCRNASAIILRFLQDVCSIFEQFPRCYWVTDKITRGRRIATGAEATIFKGYYNGMEVAIREPHFPGEDDWTSRRGQELLRDIRRELVAHWQLRHENILRLIGVYQETVDDAPAMVLPYMPHGSAQKFLRIYGDPDTFLHVLSGAARGLEYLHSRRPPIVHGDLHDTNIVIDQWGNALLCDFGFSRIRHDISRTFTTVRSGGRPLFVAPELSSGSVLRPTESSDLYSLAMVIYTLGTGKPPFADHANQRVAMRGVEEGERPPPPTTLGDLGSQLTLQLYHLVQTMWSHRPSDRIGVTSVLESVDELLRLQRKTATHWSPPYNVGGPAPPRGAQWSDPNNDSHDHYDWQIETSIPLLQSIRPDRRSAFISQLVIRAIGDHTRVDHLTDLFARRTEFCTEEMLLESLGLSLIRIHAARNEHRSPAIRSSSLQLWPRPVTLPPQLTTDRPVMNIIDPRRISQLSRRKLRSGLVEGPRRDKHNLRRLILIQNSIVSISPSPPPTLSREPSSSTYDPDLSLKSASAAAEWCAVHNPMARLLFAAGVSRRSVVELSRGDGYVHEDLLSEWDQLKLDRYNQDMRYTSSASMCRTRD